MLRAAWLLVRLRFRRMVNAMSVGFRPRRRAGGQRAATPPKSRAGFVTFFGVLMMLSFTNLSYQMVTQLDHELGRAGGEALADRGLAVELALLLAAALLVGVGSRELAAPEWDLEWLSTLPIPRRALLAIRIVERTVVNPTGIVTVVPFLSVVAFARGAGLASPLVGAALAVPLLALVAAARTVVDTGLRLVLAPPQLRNLQALLSIAAILAFYVALSSTTSQRSLVFFAAPRLPPALDWLAPGAAIAALRGRGGSVVVAAGALLGQVALGVGGCLALLEHLLRSGVVAGGGRESARDRAAHALEHGPPSAAAPRQRRLLTPIQARDLRLLARDRAFLVQTVVLPVVILGAQLVVNTALLPSIRENPAHLGAVAFGVGAYALLFSALQALNTEGHALWLLYTVPQSLESVLRDKTRLWAAVASLYPALVLGVTLGVERKFSLEIAAIVVIAMAGVPIYAVIAASLGVLACDPLAQEVQRRVRVSYVYLYMLLASIYSYAIYASSIWQRLALMTLAALLSLALWQKARDELPYLLDPAARPPARVSLSDGLIAALVFFVVQGLIVVVATKLDAPPGPSVLVAFVVAGAVSFVGLRLVFWRAGAEGVPKVFGDGLGRAAGLALAGAAVASGVGFAYLFLLQRFGWLAEAEREGALDAAALGPWLAVLAVVAAPVFEEFIFRGLIFGGLRRSIGPVGAAVASAAIFAVVHPPIAVAPVFCLGVCAALVYERTRLLLAPMAVHALYNAAVIVSQRALH